MIWGRRKQANDRAKTELDGFGVRVMTQIRLCTTGSYRCQRRFVPGKALVFRRILDSKRLEPAWECGRSVAIETEIIMVAVVTAEKCRRRCGALMYGRACP